MKHSFLFFSGKLYTVFFVVGLLFVFVCPVWAVQSHGGIEGLVSHEIGHLLFVVGMSFLLFRLYPQHRGETGWLEFKLFIFFILLWNGLTFSGHWMGEYVDHDQFVLDNGRIVFFVINSFADAYFYLTHLDHFFLILSFLFLFLALRKWRQV